MNAFVQRLAGMVLTAVIGAALACLSVPTPAWSQQLDREIDQVRKLSVLGEQQLEVIDNFVKTQFDVFLRTRDAAKLAEPLNELLTRTQVTDKPAETQKKYSDQFTNAVKKNYRQVMTQAGSMEDKNLAKEVKLAAAIVLANCDNILVIDDLSGLAKDEQEDFRYWAIKGLTTPIIRAYLTAPENSDTLRKVITELDGVLAKETSAVVISQIAEVVPGNLEEGAKLLQDCINKRLTQYQNWTVDNELNDLEIMQKIFALVGSPELAGNPKIVKDLVRSTTELYCAAYQRYVKGMQAKGPGDKNLVVLSDTSRQDLETLLIEGELGFLRICKRMQQGRFLLAMQSARWVEMKVIITQLIGPQGWVNQTFGITLASANQELPGPLIPDPPDQLIQNAFNLQSAQGNTIGSDQYSPPVRESNY